MNDLSDLSVYDVNGEFIRLKGELAQGLRKLTEAEKRDISYLTEEKFRNYFNEHKPECEGTSTGYLGSWNYPDIMNDFRDKVLNAISAANDYGALNRNKPIWAKMRDKYFDGKPYVYPDEMIGKLSEFDNKEIVAFLHYCVCYKERFCDGAYGSYARSGIIGKLLARLAELSPTLSI